MDRPLFEELGNDAFRVAGNFPLDEFEERMRMTTNDDEHTTIGGFLMAQSDKIPEAGDELEYSGLHFRVEKVNAKRVDSIIVHKTMPLAPEKAE